jgi:hypothetical protein
MHTCGRGALPNMGIVRRAMLLLLSYAPLASCGFANCSEDATRRWYAVKQFATDSRGTLVERNSPDCFLRLFAGEAPYCMDATWYSPDQRSKMHENARIANFSGWAQEQLGCCIAYESDAPRFCKERYSATASIFTAYTEGTAEAAPFITSEEAVASYLTCSEDATRQWYAVKQFATDSDGKLVERNWPDCFLQVMFGEAPACMDANWY